MRNLRVSAMRNSSVPVLCPALINAPMSVLRAVMTPAKGATTRLNDSRSRNRATLAAAESAAAFFAAASPDFLVRILLGYRLGGKQSLPARIGALGESSRSPAPSPDRPAPGVKLLIDFRRLDLAPATVPW